MNFKLLLHTLHLYTPSKPEYQRHIDLTLASDKIQSYRKLTLLLLHFHLTNPEGFDEGFQKHVKEIGKNQFSRYCLILFESPSS